MASQGLQINWTLVCSIEAAMSSEDDFVDMTTSHKTVILLFFFLLFLVLLLLFLYKRLNKQTNGEYTVSNMVLGEGGLQDRGRDLLQDSCLTPLWVRRWADRDDEEGRKGDDEDDEDESDGRTSVPNNKHPIYEKSKLIVVVEQARGGREEEEEEEEEEEVEEEEKEVEEEEKDGSSEEGAQGASLMINLKQFSGGAMWSEDDKDDGTIIDLTVL